MTRTNLGLFENVNFSHGKSTFTRILWLFTSLFFFETRIPFPIFLKVFLLRTFGAVIGQGLVLKPNVKIKYPWRLEVGDCCWIGENVWIDNLVKVRISSNVCLSQGVYILTGNHDYKKSSFNLITGEVDLEEGVWIGAKSIVGPGVTCYSHAVLSAGSITFSNLQEFCIYQGNPAVFKRKRVILFDSQIENYNGE